jgi:hypothetical protein
VSVAVEASSPSITLTTPNITITIQ